MAEPSSFYTRLANRKGFNTSVRHITSTLDVLDSISKTKNIADLINSMIIDKEFEAEQTLSTINMLLVEKGGYTAISSNIPEVTTDAESLVKEVARWKAVDIVIGYHHPDLGFIVINPKNPESAPVIAGFRKNELVVVYAGTDSTTATTEQNTKVAVSSLMQLLSGKKAAVPASVLSGSYAFKVEKKPAAVKKTVAKARTSKKATMASASSKTSVAEPTVAVVAVPSPISASRMSSLVSIVVSNELFHNGNVEAWKRIIRSYNAKYPNLKVHIYYDGERIVDINTLFKWGKVKHGSCIQFCVSGENIQDLAKLSRYFRQGASPQFEAFLHGSPDTVMNLF